MLTVEQKSTGTLEIVQSWKKCTRTSLKFSSLSGGTLSGSPYPFAVFFSQCCYSCACGLCSTPNEETSTKNDSSEDGRCWLWRSEIFNQNANYINIVRRNNFGAWKFPTGKKLILKKNLDNPKINPLTIISISVVLKIDSEQ